MDADTASTLFIEWVYANPGLPPEDYANKLVEYIAPCIAELEMFRESALERLNNLSLALTRIECETPDAFIRSIARDALYGKAT